MARMKLTTRKHVCALPCRNIVTMESHNDGQNVGYFSRTLQTVLLALGSSKPPLFIRTLRLLGPLAGIATIQNSNGLIDFVATKLLAQKSLKTELQLKRYRVLKLQGLDCNYTGLDIK
jgi:hypothetical protein